MGMTLRERISVAKAGITQGFLEKIHQFWRKSELVRLKFHEDLAHDMKTAHEIVEGCRESEESDTNTPILPGHVSDFSEMEEEDDEDEEEEFFSDSGDDDTDGFDYDNGKPEL